MRYFGKFFASIFTLSLILCVSALVTRPVYASVSWTENQPAGGQDRGWATVSISGDGQKVLVGNQDGGLYISGDGGSNWGKITPSGSEFDVWYTSGMSKSGRIILAGVYGGSLYISRDGGDGWTEVQPAGSSGHNWLNTSMSSGGQVILVSYESGRLYRSLDEGNTWSEVRPAGNSNFTWYTAVSGDGKTMLAGGDAGSGGRLYISHDSGTSWTETRPNGDSDWGWRTMGMSSDGKTMIAGISGTGIYESTDGGVGWRLNDPPGASSDYWVGSTVSEDGMTIVLSNTSRLYLSSDRGNTWSETQPAGSVDKDWELGGISGDGQILFSGAYSGRLYKGTNPRSIYRESHDKPSCTKPITTPDLFQISTSKNTATLYYMPVADAKNYQISYGFDSKADQFSVMTGQGTSTGVLAYTVNALPSGSTMYFKIYAQNDCGQGKWSNPISVMVGTNRKYYKSLLSQVVATLLPQKSTSLNTSAQTSLGGKCRTYTVQSGDSLWNIASQSLGSGKKFGDIMHANNLKDTHLHTGQQLKLGC